MEFDIEKCAMLMIRSGKRHKMDGMEQPNQDKIRTFGEKETNIREYGKRTTSEIKN